MAHVWDRYGRRVDLTKATDAQLAELAAEFTGRAVVDEQAARLAGRYKAMAERSLTAEARSMYLKLAEQELAKARPGRVAQGKERVAASIEKAASAAATTTERAELSGMAAQLRQQAAELRKDARSR